MMKLFNLLLFLCVSITSFGQTRSFRRLILNSDLILTPHTYSKESQSINDYTDRMYVTLSIDSIYKNKLSKVPQSLKAREILDNQDYFSAIYQYGNACVLTDGHDVRKEYYDIVFIKKVKKEYEILSLFTHLDSDKYNQVIDQIVSLRIVEDEKDEKLRFVKTVDWYIENGILPEMDFIEYYKQKGLTTDTIQYTENQLKNALKKFQGGKEELLPLVREKYFSEIKTYYLGKMNSIMSSIGLSYSDYYDFDKCIYRLTNNFGSDYESGDYILTQLLTSDTISEYEKGKIMKHLLQVAEDFEM